MGPIELGYIGIGLTLALVGVARGYSKELGVTIICMVAIFLLTFFQSQITGVINFVAEGLFNITDPTQLAWFTGTAFTVVFVMIVFASYAGTTLDFKGKESPAPQGTLISLGIGLLNGYLIAGTLWYYQNDFDYPLQRIFDIDPWLTPAAQVMVEYLPPDLFSNPVYWMIPVAILLLLRVRG